MQSLRVGTCSWKYPSWEGLVYSRASGIDYLAEYARKYTSVEIDQWFWSMPDPATASAYVSAVPAEFRFTVKAPNAITLTHLRGRKGQQDLATNPDFLSVELFREFLSRLQPMEGRIGMLMLQFEYLNKKKMESKDAFLSRLSGFFEALEGLPSALWPCAIETRNPNYLDERYFEFLASHGLAHVFLQGYYMPQIVPLYERFGRLLRGSVVVRLHGTDRAGIEKLTGERWDRIVAPRDEELASIAAMLKDMTGRGLTVYLNVNNHYEGSAPLTIERLAAHGIVDSTGGALRE